MRAGSTHIPLRIGWSSCPARRTTVRLGSIVCVNVSLEFCATQTQFGQTVGTATWRYVESADKSRFKDEDTNAVHLRLWSLIKATPYRRRRRRLCFLERRRVPQRIAIGKGHNLRLSHQRRGIALLDSTREHDNNSPWPCSFVIGFCWWVRQVRHQFKRFLSPPADSLCRSTPFFFSLSIHSARRWSVASSDSSGPFKTASRQSVGFRVFTEQGEQAARRPDDEAKTGRAGAFQQVRGRDENARADHGADD